MFKRQDRKVGLKRRHMRIRKTVSGTNERPRMAVAKSLANIYVQLIDDVAGTTLASVSTIEPDVKSQIGYGGNVKAAAEIGKLIAKRAIEKGITTVVFDRGGNLYHGRIAALAQAAREAGLKF